MTDREVLAVRPGDTLAFHCSSGVACTRTVAEVTKTGLCTYEPAGPFGHAWALLAFYFPDPSSTSRLSTSIESDEYIRASGYRTHDATGKRVSGWELIPAEAEPAPTVFLVRCRHCGRFLADDKAKNVSTRHAARARRFASAEEADSAARERLSRAARRGSRPLPFEVVAVSIETLAAAGGKGVAR